MVLAGAAGVSALADIGGIGSDKEPAPILFLPDPTLIDVVQLGVGVDEASITDVEILDFTGDGLGDVAVAWYANDAATGELSRFLTLFAGNGTDLPQRLFDLDLYRPSNFPAPLDDSVFRQGTGEIVVGDYDGDGDPDLAVLPFFSSEVWFIENLGGGSYASHLKYMFGAFGGGFLTPPEGVSGDFDGDGRRDLAYVVSVTPHVSGPIHFWRTDGAIADMRLVSWEGIAGGVPTTWTLGLAAGELTADGRADVVFTAIDQLTLEPVLVTWHSLDVATQEFQVSLEYPWFQPSDVVGFRNASGCRDIAISDVGTGELVEIWTNSCDGTGDFSPGGLLEQLSGTSPGRGAVLRAADVNGDGQIDLVCRQRGGSLSDDDQLELFVKGPQGNPEYYLEPGAFDTSGFEEDGSNQLLRPRNLAVVDMFGSSDPEVAAAFVVPITAGAGQTLQLGIWSNGCVGDVTGDGSVDVRDLGTLLFYLGSSTPSSMPGTDLNRNGVIDLVDFTILLSNYGCSVE